MFDLNSELLPFRKPGCYHDPHRTAIYSQCLLSGICLPLNSHSQTGLYSYFSKLMTIVLFVHILFPTVVLAATVAASDNNDDDDDDDPSVVSNYMISTVLTFE